MILEKIRMLLIRFDSQVIVGPANPKPAELGLRITRIFYTVNKAVIVEGDPNNSAILRNCALLLDAGLTVQDKVKINPCLIVRDIPTDLSSDEIRVALHKQIFPDHIAEDFKIVYLFPVRKGKKSRFCIIKTTPECRKALCTSNRVYIGLCSYRCADNISILQCLTVINSGTLRKSALLKHLDAAFALEHTLLRTAFRKLPYVVLTVKLRVATILNMQLSTGLNALCSALS